MKQRITIDQINELSEEQKEQLRKWWNPEEFDVITNCKIAFVPNDYMHPDEYSSHLPLLSIGQMIEFLNANDIRPDRVESNQWWIDRWNKQDLCDQLWERVKQI